MKTRGNISGKKQSRYSMDMLHGPLAGNIIRFAIPIALASILQQLFNSADAAVAGHFVGPEALAAIGGTTPVVTLLISLFVGLSVGTNVLVALRIGQGHPEKIGAAVHTSIAVALASGMLLLVAGIAFVEPILDAIDMPDDALEPAIVYLVIFFAGMPFAMLYNFGSAVLRSRGDTRRPLYILVVAVLLNLALNIAFVTIVPWGVAGIAVATDIANAVSAFLVLRVMMKEEEPYHLSWRRVRFSKAELLIILKVGIPAGLQGVVFALSNVIIQAGINSFGSASTAGVAAAVNFEFYSYFFINGFVQAAVTFIGQNYAARQHARCDAIFKWCMLFAFAFMVVLCLLWNGLGARAVGVFTSDQASIEYGVLRLVIVQAFQWLPVFYEIPAGAMRGMGWSMTPTSIIIVGSCVLRIIWIETVFSWQPDFYTLMVIYPITWAITGIAMLFTFYFVRKRAYAKY